MTGIELIAQERKRQIDDKLIKFDPTGRVDSGLWAAALNFVCIKEKRPILWKNNLVNHLPAYVDEELDDKTTRIRELQIAGALIAAEIDRLQAIDGKE